MADTNNKYNFLDYEGLSLFWDNVKKVIEDNEFVTATALTDLDARVVQLEDTGSNQGAVPNQTIAISYADLKALRDNAQLVPGQQYRIIDYTCTTVQENTKSAGHVFDIIITADSESVLNEEARAIQHEGDSYFANCDLNTWKIWYCLDNDTTRFTWADTTNGKGVIYRMIDEWNNDIPYDFKNIMFARDWPVIASDSGLTGTIYCYTFSVFLDGFSVDTIADDESVKVKECIESDKDGIFGNNVIKPHQNLGIWSLNDIVFVTNWSGACVYHYNNSFGNDCSSNTFGHNCYGNSFGNSCYSNTFGYYCYNNTVGNECHNNTFGHDCYNNAFGNSCYSNTFGDYCYSNSLSDDCYYNSFNNSCYYNSFGYNCNNNSFMGDCYYNSFDNECYSNSLSNSCRYNTFWNYCYSNTLGNSSSYNFFGIGCYSNTLGSSCFNNAFRNKCFENYFGNNCDSNFFQNGCRTNTFGNKCSSNTFRNSCNNITFGNECNTNTLGNKCQYLKFASDSSASTKYSYYRCNNFGDRCQNILFKGTETASLNAQIQNYNFAQGTSGTEAEYLTIDGIRNRAFETKVAQNSNGEPKMYCEADLIA